MLVKWGIVLLACLGAYCGLRAYAPGWSGKVVTVFDGHEITWAVVVMLVIIMFGFKLKSE